MSRLRVVAAELRKTATLPAALAAVAVAGPVTLAITLLNAFAVRDAVQSGQPWVVGYTSPVEVAFSAAPLGTVGAVILGVVAISSEYTATSSDAGGGRPITATLTGTPQRLAVLTAKAAAVVVLVAALAAVTLPTSLWLAYLVVGGAPAPDGLDELVARSAGAALYWVLMGLIAMAVTVLTRSGILPLVVLITNSSLVSVSLLLIPLTPLARYLPDLAGIRLFAGDWIAVDDPLDPVTGGLVMAGWAGGLLAVSAIVFHRRDA